MAFEFDPDKSQKNQLKHGINFNEAQSLWEDQNRVSFIARCQDEERHGIIAQHANKLWCAICTHRKDNIRIISVRRARAYEENLYNNS